MTANLLVLKFVDEGKLTVDEAVQLLETIAVETEQEESVTDESPAPVTVWIFQGNGF